MDLYFSSHLLNEWRQPTEHHWLQTAILLLSHMTSDVCKKPQQELPLLLKTSNSSTIISWKIILARQLDCHVRLTVHKYGPQARLGPGLNWTGWWMRWWWMDRRTGGYVGGTESRADQERDWNRKRCRRPHSKTETDKRATVGGEGE